MKGISSYISERLKFNKGFRIRHYDYRPKYETELLDCIWNIVNRDGKDCDLNPIDTSQITTMESLFCISDDNNDPLWDIGHIEVDEWDVSNVTDFYQTFNGCMEVEADLSKWDVSKGRNFEFMFDMCQKFNSDLSQWNMSNARTTYGMFSDCTSLDFDASSWNIDIDNCNTVHMFKNCNKMKDKLPDWYAK